MTAGVVRMPPGICSDICPRKATAMNAGTALLTTTGSDIEVFPSLFSSGPGSAACTPETLLLDQLRLSIPEMRQSFLSALPWPHLVLDDLIDPMVAATAEKQEAALATQLRPHRSHRMVKAESSVPGGPAAAAILAEMLSPRFIALLEGVTGIRNLIGDPKHFAGGLHVSGRGAFQSVHTDFERHSVPGLYHRVNVLLYLNSEWEADFGGELELWPKDMTECGRKIAPLLGRIVIFVTDPNTVHGVPDPVQCPPGALPALIGVVLLHHRAAAAHFVP